MKSAVWFERSIRHKAWRPQSLRWIMQDRAGTARQAEHDHRTHLRATLEWLTRAQDAGGGEPAARGWSFALGWLPADAETTALLAETWGPAAAYLAWPELEARAARARHTLLAQADAGSAARVHGLLSAADDACVARAEVAARRLVDAGPGPAPAEAEAAHALARLARVTGNAAWNDAARERLARALAQQTPCGWFPGEGTAVTLYALAGAIRGVVEAAALLEDAHALGLAERAGHALYLRLSDVGRLAGAYDDGWTPAAEHASPAGLARIAACWLRLAQMGEGGHWREGAWRALSWIKRNQRLDGEDADLRGAVPNTVPIWGGPGAFTFDALGAKYFADALMMDMVGIAIPPAQPSERA